MSKRCKDLKSEKDMLSSLSDDIIDMILMRLPLEEAINTSLLSRSWRYMWRSISQINIGDCFSCSNFQELATKVNLLLLVHRGNIQKFVYPNRYGFYEDSPFFSLHMDIWLDYLVRSHCIEQLDLNFGYGAEYLIPSFVYSSDNLKVLKLQGVKIKLPSSFDGFKSLTSLDLDNITIDDGDTITLTRLINLCPVLKHLNLVLDNYENTVIELCAPNLRSLEFTGWLGNFCLKDTPLITNASLFDVAVEDSYDLSNILCGLSKVVQLKLLGLILSNGILNKSSLQEIKFNFLKKLEIDVNMNCSKEIAIVYCILKNSPALVYLHLKSPVIFIKEFNNISRFDNISFKFRHLKIFEMVIFFGSKLEMKFLKFVLHNAPLLKVCNITKGKPYNFSEENRIERKLIDIMRELLSFKRSSSSAKVNVLVSEEE